MALNLNIKNQVRRPTIQSATDLPVRKVNKFVDLKLDLQQSKIGNPLYFDQTMVNGTDIAIATDEEAIIEFLRNFFSCSPGDLFLNPEFGINLRRYTFEPVTERVANEIGNQINSNFDAFALLGRDNLVRLEKVYIYPNVDQSQFEIAVLFQIPSLQKQITIFGTISSQDGVYFFTK